MSIRRRGSPAMLGDLSGSARRGRVSNQATSVVRAATGGNMEPAIKTPEQLLRYRSLRQILAEKPEGVYALDPGSSVFSAIELMAGKNIGLVVVQQNGKLVGVLSERDYARKVILKGRSSKDALVRDIMSTPVVTVALDQTIPQCMALMNAG